MKRPAHNSPCTLMRTWLRQMGLILRPVSAEYLSTGHLSHKVTKGSLRSPCSPGHLTLTFPETNSSLGKNIKKSSTNDDRLNTLRYSIFFFFVLSNKVYLNPLRTLQSTNIVKYKHCNVCRPSDHTEIFLTNFPCSKVRAGRTGGAGDSAGVVVLLGPREAALLEKSQLFERQRVLGFFSGFSRIPLQP